MKKYIINKNGNIKGFYVDDNGIIFTHWLNDEEILIHENTFHNELVFCYNFDLINEWRNEDIKLEIHKLEKRLKALKGSDINE